MRCQKKMQHIACKYERSLHRDTVTCVMRIKNSTRHQGPGSTSSGGTVSAATGLLWRRQQ